MHSIDTIVIGAGQAGLAASYELSQRNIAHIVLERNQIGSSWSNRWDSFCLVTPNWSLQLPGFHYDGDDPDGFMPRGDVVDFLKRYAASFDCPVRTGANIEAVRSHRAGGFEVELTGETLHSNNLVVATGAFQKPLMPRGVESLPDHIQAISIADYTNPDALPGGGVLVVGSGQTGCQIAEELNEAGKEVVLSCGRAPWAPRWIGPKDLFWWLLNSGFLDVTAEAMPPAARLFANVQATGHAGGHDLHYRTLAAQGITLAGRFLGSGRGAACFAPDLAESVAWGDEKHGQLRGFFEKFAAKAGMAPPDMPDPEPFDLTGPESLDLSEFGTVFLTGGFRPDFTSWLPWTHAFDDAGFPIQTDGASDVINGLYFVGVHFLRTRKSGLLCGAGGDAGVVADQLTASDLKIAN